MARAPKHIRRRSATIRALRARFDEAHADGLAALRRRDYAALGDAITREGEIIREQAALIDDAHVLLAELREQVRSSDSRMVVGHADSRPAASGVSRRR